MQLLEKIIRLVYVKLTFALNLTASERARDEVFQDEVHLITSLKLLGCKGNLPLFTVFPSQEDSLQFIFVLGY